jgi:hypothetical protein
MEFGLPHPTRNKLNFAFRTEYFEPLRFDNNFRKGKMADEPLARLKIVLEVWSR